MCHAVLVLIIDLDFDSVHVRQLVSRIANDRVPNLPSRNSLGGSSLRLGADSDNKAVSLQNRLVVLVPSLHVPRAERAPGSSREDNDNKRMMLGLLQDPLAARFEVVGVRSEKMRKWDFASGLGALLHGVIAVEARNGTELVKGVLVGRLDAE